MPSNIIHQANQAKIKEKQIKFRSGIQNLGA
jgi:hypothetical protein